MKKVLITSFHNLISRNILAPLLPLLREHGYTVVLAVPEKKTEYFSALFDATVTIEGVTVPKRPFEDFLALLSLGLVGVDNHIVHDWKVDGKWLKFGVVHLVHRLFSRFFIFHRIVRSLSLAHLPSAALTPLLHRHSPNLVFATDLFQREDVLFLEAARKLGVPTIGMVRSWDNTSTKGVFLPRPDSIIVPNSLLQDELVATHRVPRARITITGLPHYDTVLRAPLRTREAFLASLGLDPKKKTILFTPRGKMIYKHDDRFLMLLREALERKSFSMPVQFLIRLPPSDTVDTTPIEGDASFVVDVPGQNITGRRKESELSQDDNEHLNDSLRFSDVLVSLGGSTMVIDASVFNTPALILGFDPVPHLPDTIGNLTEQCFKKLIDTGPIPVSHSKEEFLAQVNELLLHKECTIEVRRRVVERYAYRLDGRSTERVFSCIEQALNEGRTI